MYSLPNSLANSSAYVEYENNFNDIPCTLSNSRYAAKWHYRHVRAFIEESPTKFFVTISGPPFLHQLFTRCSLLGHSSELRKRERVTFQGARKQGWEKASSLTRHWYNINLSERGSKDNESLFPGVRIHCCAPWKGRQGSGNKMNTFARGGWWFQKYVKSRWVQRTKKAY